MSESGDYSQTGRQSEFASKSAGNEERMAQTIVGSIQFPLLLLSAAPHLTIQLANSAFYECFHARPSQTEGRPFWEIGDGQWNIPRLRELLEGILPTNRVLNNFEVEHDFEQIGHKVMLLNAQRINHHPWILLAIQDITDQKLSQKRQKLLTGELQHRVKNILLNVRALAQQTKRTSHSLEDFSQAFEGRVNALARTQDLLVRSAADTAKLRDLIGFELTALGAEEGHRLTLEGPDIELSSRVAQSMSMTVHELATNALKYGALSSESGAITIYWSQKRTGGKRLVRINWRERGVRIDTGNPRKGFGRELIERSLPYLLGGFSRLTLHPDGAECQIEFANPEV